MLSRLGKHKIWIILALVAVSVILTWPPRRLEKEAGSAAARDSLAIAVDLVLSNLRDRTHSYLKAVDADMVKSAVAQIPKSSLYCPTLNSYVVLNPDPALWRAENQSTPIAFIRDRRPSPKFEITILRYDGYYGVMTLHDVEVGYPDVAADLK